MSARELPPLPWRARTVTRGYCTMTEIVGADGRVAFGPLLNTEAIEVLCRPDVAALLRGEAVAVPKEPTDDMVVAGENALPAFWAIRSIYRAMLAASPFAKEGKE